MNGSEPAAPTTGERATRGLLWAAAERYGQHTIALFAFIALSRILAPEAFGIVAMGLVFTALVDELIDLGIGPALVQRSTLEQGHVDAALATNIAVGVTCAALGWFGAGLIAGVFRTPALAPAVRWLSLGFVFEGFVVTQESLLKRDLRFRDLSIRTFAASSIASIAAIIAALLGAGVWSLVIYQLMRRAVEVVVLWSAGSWRPRPRFSMPHFREIVGFSWYMLGTRLLVWVSQRSDDLFVGVFLGPKDLGYYSMGYRGFSLLNALLSGVMNNVAFPALATLQSDRPRFLRAFGNASAAHAMIVFPVYAAVVVFGGDVVQLLLGPTWAPAGTVLRILALVGVGQATGAMNGAVLMALGRSDWLFRLNVLTTVVNVVGFAIAVRWGITAVAAAFVIRAYVLSPLGFYVLRQVAGVDLRFHFAQFAAPATATLLATAAAGAAVRIAGQSAGDSSAVTLALAAGVGVPLYVASLYVFAPTLTREMLDRVKRVLPRTPIN